MMLLTSVLALLSSGCSYYQSEINKDSEYREVISAILITEDHAKIVVVTPEFHYVFDSPQNLYDVLTTSFRKRIVADRISGFRVNRPGEVRGFILLSFMPNNASEEAEALEAGMIKSWFVSKKTEYLYNKEIRGKRYDATGFKVPAEMQKLNKPHVVVIRQEVTDSEKRVRLLKTPLTIASDNRWMLYATPAGLFTEMMMKITVTEMEKVK